MKDNFPKSARLRRRGDFLRMRNSSRRNSGKYLAADIRENSVGQLRLGITVTKKFGKACRRNRLKRIVREAFRLNRPKSKAGFDVHIRPKNGANAASSKELSGEIISFLLSAPEYFV